MADREALMRKLAEAKARSKRADATSERPRRDLDWMDVGKSAASGLRSGLESTAGGIGDIGGLQAAATSYGAERLGLSPETAATIGKYTSPMSLFPSTEDVSAATDATLGRDSVTRHEATSPQGKSISTAAEFLSGIVGGPENLGKDVLLKLGMSLIPAAKLAGKGVKKVGREALTEAVAEPALKKGRQEAITAVSLRDKPLPEAIDIAKSERHIIPAGKTGGGTSFVGAPFQAKTRADIDRLRAEFDKDVGAGSGGADWYQRAQDWIKKTAGPEPARQSELARNLSLFSAQADPSSNLGFSVQARNAAIMGTPAEAVRTGQQADTYNKAFQTGADIPLGPKTGIYAQHLDPTASSPTTGTNDIWHARALGYGEPEMVGGLSPQKHAWMDAETVLAVDRANQAGIGGRTDWTPGEVQAAPWVAGKGRGLMQTRKNMTEEQGLAEAAKTYPDYAPRYTAYGTHEMTPGSTTKHLPDVAASAASKEAYANEPGSWWQGPGGRDALYEAQGAYVGPSNKTVGIYDEPGGERVIGPAQAATPLVSWTGPETRRVVDKPSQQMMTGTEAFRAMMDAQDAGAWSAQRGRNQAMGHMNAFEVPLAAGQQDRDALTALMSKAQGVGMADTVHQGPQALLTNFGGPEGLTGAQVKNVQAAIPGAQPVRRESDYIGYDWSKPGSDTVTKEMLSKLNPAQEAAFSRPEVRQQVLAKMDRDALVAARTGQPVRKDLQTARQIFADGGIPALKAAIGKGLLPVAMLGALLPMMADQEDRL